MAEMAEEDVMGIFLVISFVLVAGLFIAAIVTLFFKEGLIEVAPMRAVVCKNLWDGIPFALNKGMHQIIPGVHKKIREVTLENEPSDPQKCDVITGDGVGIGIDYVIYTQKVVNPVKVVTEIDYEKRRGLITDRIKAYFQDQATKYSTEDFIAKEGLKIKIKKDLLNDVENDVNQSLVDGVENQWGIRVEIQVQNIKLPQKLEEVVEEAATAEKEGERIRVKAEKAGVPPWLMAIGDMIYDVVRATKGGNK
ncbi:hypothetical protein CO177_00940 [Candidatus Wolfebacteria bacterium CG_4_9_14_3_um_filter_37_9]|uniref:Band 7 domain-containing protein n=1 Tax=Candidatus Wolfebacteria bacterium CG_4_9_14_3_um_filter_37_9 TaxID=1975065 RepID=A0A2M7X6E8_9BACT|nr:MAG: hypothetical protein CO177_00940 [Candidatus Wolfebacteria bacterium CG_4_9_14_3_um_filter_37_9]